MHAYVDGMKLRRKYENMADRIIDNDAAKPFNILSAYFMTIAMTNPPNACKTSMERVT